jgi:hypothetical protein
MGLGGVDLGHIAAKIISCGGHMGRCAPATENGRFRGPELCVQFQQLRPLSNSPMRYEYTVVLRCLRRGASFFSLRNSQKKHNSHEQRRVHSHTAWSVQGTKDSRKDQRLMQMCWQMG